MHVCERGDTASDMSEDSVSNCTISHEIHQYLFSSVYILVLLVRVGTFSNGAGCKKPNRLVILGLRCLIDWVWWVRV